MNLYEVLESPYAAARWKWIHQNPKEWTGVFVLGDREYTVSIKKTIEPENAYSVNLSYVFFDKNGKPLVNNNAGDTTFALTTLTHMVNEFAHHMRPKQIIVHPGDWRLKAAYKDRFSKMFSGWKVVGTKTSGAGTITITSKP
jgi:hypothetical protein